MSRVFSNYVEKAKLILDQKWTFFAGVTTMRIWSAAPMKYYETATIYDQLEDAAKSFVNSSEVIVLPEEGKVLLSEIFRWYQSDFGGKRGVLDFLYDYMADEHARQCIQEKGETLQFEYIYYDWNLNR